MIKKLRVDSFKSLERAEVNLGQVNVFVGANGSGKSNLLEALGVLGAAAFGRVDDESLLRRGVRPGVPQLYKSAFPTTPSGRRPHIFFGAESAEATYEVSLWNPLDDPKPAWRFKTESLRFSGATAVVERAPYRKPGKWLNDDQGYVALKSVEFSQTDARRALLDSLRNYAIYCANTPALRGLTQDQQVREPLGLSGGRLPDAISELIRAREADVDGSLGKMVQQIYPLIDWMENFGWAPADRMPLSPTAATARRVIRFRDRFMKKSRNVLSGYDASEGALYILFAAVLALHPKSPLVFAIDNFDQSLNPRLAMRMASTFCSWILESPVKRQVFLTSHNPAVLDGLPLGDDRVRLFTTDRDSHGRTVISRVEITPDLMSKSKEGWTLSRLWMNSLIGGVPDV